MDPRIAFFDALAERWDAEKPSAVEMTAGLDRHASLLALRPGEMLLEVGCGTGKTTAYLADRVAPGRVTAVDFSPAMIEKARRKNLNADFLLADVCSDELGEAKYDVVLCFHSFPHFRDPPAALRRLARSLKKPAGRLIVMHLAGSEAINRFHASLEGAVRSDFLPTSEQWTPLLAQASLQQTLLIDREDLFFLQAVPLPCGKC